MSLTKRNHVQCAIPLLKLGADELYLPEGVYQKQMTKRDGLSVLSPFANMSGKSDRLGKETLSDTFSREVISGIGLLTPRFSSDNEPCWLIGCIPSQGKHAALCRIVKVNTKDQNFVIILQALARCRVVDLEKGHVEVDISTSVTAPLKNKAEFLNRSQLLFQLLNDFVSDYNNALNSSFQKKNHFLILSPLANLLYVHLNKVESVSLLKTCERIFTWDEVSDSDALRLGDLIGALFPFQYDQKLKLLAAMESSVRFTTCSRLVEFAIDVFRKTLDTTLLYSMWKTLQARGVDGDNAKTQVIGHHLKGIRMLMNGFTKSKSIHSKSPSNTFSGGGEDEDDDLGKVRQFVDNLDGLKMSEDGKRMVKKDFRRVQKLQSNNADYHILMNYLDIVMDIPWSNSIHGDLPSIDAAKKQLDNDHFGLQMAKSRIVQYIAVLKLHSQIRKHSESKAPILLLSGPPGVGKTSLAKSIATTMNRKFQRVSLGGVRDESEVRGHRRTYVGAFPGLIIQTLRKSQSMNPVILLDEIDKIADGSMVNKVHGDPAAALLEVLDPEQNKNFLDHYIGFPVDLSQVVFICTANDHYRLSEPLLDRMELIELSGYSVYEKLEIAKTYLLPRQIERSGLASKSVTMEDNVLLKVCEGYTRESGVRNLEKMIGSICRFKAIEYTKLGGAKRYDPIVTLDDLPKMIGFSRHSGKDLQISSSISQPFGVVNGLSYNTDGSGSKLVFEMIGTVGEGSATFHMTGRLGDVLKESVRIGSSVVRSILYGKLLQGVNNQKILEKLGETSIHLHVPMGSVSKDGPSAGITITLCLLSLLLERPVPQDIAMTGEITLRGLVLPIGGLKEKLLGAHLTGSVSKVLIPRLNRKDVIQEFMRSNFVESRHDELLTKLIKEEESLLKHEGEKSMRLKVFSEPEQWYKSTLGLEIIYVEEFSDVLEAVWGRGVVWTYDARDDHRCRL